MNDGERPSYDSRFNQVIKFLLSVGMTYGATALHIPPALQNAVGIAGIATILTGYDRLYAALFVNRNHQPQILYEVPWRDGVAVIQPRHRLRWNPYHWWRGRLRDVRLNTVYRVHDVFANRELADQYCQNTRVGRGIFLPADESDPSFRSLITHALPIMAQQFSECPLQTAVPENPWSVAQVEPGAYIGFRRVLTVAGSRWQFFPTPPESVSDTAVLKDRLQQSHLADPHLDRRRLDEGLEGLPSEIRQAWHAQSVAWTLVPMDTTVDHWVAKSVAADGTVEWTPPIPETMSRAVLLTRLRANAAPGQADPAISADPVADRYLWQETVWQTLSPPTQAVGVWPWTHPVAIQYRTLSSVTSRLWTLVPDRDHPQDWVAVTFAPQAAGLQAHVLRDPHHPQQLWRGRDPEKMANLLHQTWPHDSVQPWPSSFAWPHSVNIPNPSPSSSPNRVKKPGIRL